MFLTNRVKLTKGKNGEQCLKKWKVQGNSRFVLLLKVFPGAEQQDFPDSKRGGREPGSHHHPGQREGHGSGSPWRQTLPAPPAGNLRLWQSAGFRAAVLQLRVFIVFFSVCHHCWFNTGGLSASDCCTTGFGTLLKAPCCNVWSTEGLLHDRQIVWSQWYRQKRGKFYLAEPCGEFHTAVVFDINTEPWFFPPDCFKHLTR